ncbi:MAG TPA: SRPBCC family protein [Jatrophihabitans sp.]|nr:SRPBCC family protein [Jatrophihabitans sp.]
MTSRLAPCTVEVCDVAAAAPSDVWAIIADPRTYANWVAGTATSRGETGDWPAVGSSLRHRWGVWPARFRDRSTVTACQHQRQLELDVRVGRLAAVAVTIRLAPDAFGTRIVLRESVVTGAALLFRPLTRRFQLWRNRRSLAALVRMSVTGAPR